MDHIDDTTFLGIPLPDRLRSLHVPGVSIAFLDHGRIEEHCYGVRRAGAADPVKPSTRFQACSISKPIAVLAMLKLVDDGRLDLDADINESLRSWQVPPSGSWQPRITLRQLASHTAGLTTSGFPGYRRDADLPTTLEVLTGTAPANTEGVRPDLVPGLQFRYCGGGTLVLQLLLEEVTGRPFAELMAESVLGPLGMTDSGYDQPLPVSLHDQAAHGHGRAGAEVPGGWHVYPEQATAGLWTTPGDLIRYAMGVQAAAAGAEGSQLGRELAGEMLRPQTPPLAAAMRIGGLNTLGLGLFLRSVDGRSTTFGHSGGNEGFRCHLLAHRHAGTAAAVMTNGDGGVPLVLEIFNAIAEQFQWSDYDISPLEGDPAPVKAVDAFIGQFVSDNGTTIEIRATEDDVAVVFGDQPPAPFTIMDSDTLVARFTDTRLTRHPDGLTLGQDGLEQLCRPIT